MMRDELLDHLFDLPTDADITVRIGDACLDITGLAPWGDQGFVSLQCYAADIRDVLKEWGVPASKREQLAAAQPTGPAQ